MTLCVRTISFILYAGQFGKVFRAVMKRGSEPVSVAVKTAKKSTTAATQEEFLREMNIMSQMVHPNIVQLFGVIKDGRCPCRCL